MTVRRVAAVDCGTNALRLLVADVDPEAGTLTDVDRRLEIVRLGEGVDATGRIAPQALTRALETLERYARRCAQLGVDRVRVVATSASRDADNADEFTAGVHRLLGVEPEVVTGDEEARLSFAGAVAGLPLELAAPYLVVDIGGGSTEVVLGADAPVAAISVDAGCVRMTERHLREDPPGPAALAAAREDVTRALDAVTDVVDLAATRTLVGLAGSVTTVTAHALRLPGYDSRRVHHAVLTAPVVRAACAELVAATRAQRSRLPYLHPGRVDVIGAGALIWDLVVERVTTAAGPVPVVTSEHDILDGVAMRLAGAEDHEGRGGAPRSVR